LNFGTNSYRLIHTIIFTNCIIRIRTRCGFCTNSYNCYTNCIVRIRTWRGFCTNSDNFYTNCIVRIHIFVPIQTIFIRIVLRIYTICLRTPQGINYLAIRNDPLAFLYEFVSRIDKKVPSAKTFVQKNWTPPFAQVCGNTYNFVPKNSSHHPQKRIMI